LEVIVILIAAALFVELIFLGAFVWAVRSGQFDDTASPAMRMLHDTRGDNHEEKKSDSSEK
jgi:cbb3-type cytochrome oxidase maturation protein